MNDGWEQTGIGAGLQGRSSYSSPDGLLSLIAQRFLGVAKSCIVTLRVTSVTHRSLAESVLIGVGKPVLDKAWRGKSLAQRGLAHFLRWFFQGGACIQ